MIDSSDLDDFIWTFIQPPKTVQLCVQGLMPLPALLAHLAENVVEWQGGYYRHIFSFSLDLTPFLVHAEPQDRSTTSAESDSVAGGISEDEIKLLRRFLQENTNELATVKLMKEVHWDCWEELATNIKQKIRQRGFEGLIHVCWTNTETLTVTRVVGNAGEERNEDFPPGFDDFARLSQIQVAIGLSTLGLVAWCFCDFRRQMRSVRDELWSKAASVLCSKCFDLGRALIPCITGSSKKPLFDPTTFRSKTRGSSAGAGRPRGAMASEGEEVEGPYDDDFEEEELSEDETWEAPPKAVAAEAKPPKAPEAEAAASSPSSPSRPSVVHRHEGGAGGAGDWPRIELRPTGGATGPPSGRRVLRGKISDSSSRLEATSPPVKDSRPLWLQHDERAAAPRSRPTPAGPGVESGAGEDAAPRGRRGTEDPAAPADDQRKVKRLQQEVQRLSQRLAESEMFSPQDDGLPRFALDEVQVGEMIAQGGFASVHVATWQCTPCALKKIFDPILTEELKSEFENEVRMLRKLRHPHVVTLMAVCRTPPALSILTELVPGGSLFEALHGPARSRSTDHAVLLPLLRQSGAALAYLHAMMVVHRDIKSQNVLLTEGSRPTAKLCDFGLARMRSELCTGSMQWAGTAPYMAPELFQKRKYDETVDVFAFGTMIWEVVSLEIPHANLDPADIAHRVKSKEAAGLALQHSWPKSLKNLLRSALSAEAEKRPAMREVVKELEGIIPTFNDP
ncbi:Probable serine/threonine-protein kinase DDB_G0267514 [Durusdinium trenchii]|uniref:Probable serine/threonine-protein kinase DDB_G0267514 n=1 Tax=Durusdinium trenchii TaxID=1381693 RepID=A0ABP0KC24_9DINO